MRAINTLLAVALIALVAGQNAVDSDDANFVSSPASIVNLFIGTTNGGNVFPGVFCQSYSTRI